MRIRLPFILALLLGLSALALVNSQYQARKLFIELEFAQIVLPYEIQGAQIIIQIKRTHFKILIIKLIKKYTPACGKAQVPDVRFSRSFLPAGRRNRRGSGARRGNRTRKPCGAGT